MIKRFIFNKLKNEINEPEINILLGPRQVGKTTLLHQLEKYCKKNNVSTSGKAGGLKPCEPLKAVVNLWAT